MAYYNLPPEKMEKIIHIQKRCKIWFSKFQNTVKIDIILRYISTSKFIYGRSNHYISIVKTVKYSQNQHNSVK